MQNLERHAVGEFPLLDSIHKENKNELDVCERNIEEWIGRTIGKEVSSHDKE